MQATATLLTESDVSIWRARASMMRQKHRRTCRRTPKGDRIMTRNESNIDRMIRVVVAVAAFAAALAVGIGSVLGIVLAVVGVVMLVTAAAGFCPLYRLFGLSTCPVNTSKAQPERTAVG